MDFSPITRHILLEDASSKDPVFSFNFRGVLILTMTFAELNQEIFPEFSG